MRQLQNGIRQSREFHGVSSMKSRMYLDEKTYYNQMAEMKESYARLQDYHDGIAASGSIKRDRVQYKAGEKKLPVGRIPAE